MRLVFAGTPEAAVPSLRALMDSRHDVVAVVTRPDARAGRGRTRTSSPIALLAAEHGLETLTPRTPRDLDFLARLREIGPDCCPVVAFGGLLPQEALDIVPHGWVNLHFSVLPAWRGAAPVQRALMAGDEVTGATTFRIVEALDAGPTYGLFTETIRPDDTSGTLLDRLSEHGAGLLVTTIDGIEDGSLEARPQGTDGASVAPKLRVDEAEVDWQQPAFAIDRLIRGCAPAPGAWTMIGEARLKLAPVAPAPSVDRLQPGEIFLGRNLAPAAPASSVDRLQPGEIFLGRKLAPAAPAPSVDRLQPGEIFLGKNTVLVGTGTHPVELTDVQAQGKPRMRAAEWARGLRPMPARLGR